MYGLGDAIAAWHDDACANHFPRFHRHDRRPAFRADKGKGTVRCQGRRIQLPVIGSVRMLRPLRPQGRILEVTLTYEVGRWWVCVAVEMRRPPRSTGTQVIGVDVGLGTIAVCSDGTRFEIPEELKSLRRDIGRFRRRLTRQVEGSARHGRVRQQLEDARYRARCLREEAQHRAAREIVARTRMVVMEGLDIRDMMSRGGRCLTRGITRAGMGGLHRKIAYRCEAAGVRLVEAPGDYPSIRTCSRCSALQDMPLGKRVYDCVRCGLVMDTRRQRRSQPAALRRGAAPVKHAACGLWLAGGVKRRGGCHPDGGRRSVNGSRRGAARQRRGRLHWRASESATPPGASRHDAGAAPGSDEGTAPGVVRPCHPVSPSAAPRQSALRAADVNCPKPAAAAANDRRR